MLEPAANPKATFLRDYAPPGYWADTVDLTFELGETATTVTSVQKLVRNKKNSEDQPPLVLFGKNLKLIEIQLDEVILKPTAYKLDAEKLVIPNVPDKFQLKVITQIKPRENTELMGLFYSNDIYCTQCEPEGFRRMTYYLDRPDVLASFTTTIIADKTKYPILLSNGNVIDSKNLSDNRHAVTWQDPFKKPSYLFALVAGDLDFIEDKFKTQSGREVILRIFVDKGQREKAYHAMECVKKAMRWDEKAYGREYDLDIFMIVAINDFNMGAMENKGLNIFNAKYILAKPETATDIDYEGVLIVVGHEYFHNWSGDRVTCRDWFQLSLKEGLTVFREQEFTADMTSSLVARINGVRNLRQAQFQEDSGPLAHPVQPDSYIEINNFYTATVYSKGAEVIRMIKVLLGVEKFRKGMDLYFERNDGHAVTIEDFVKAMEDASGHDLNQFRLWYHQAGTPELTVNTNYDAAKKEYTLNIKQYCPPTPNQKDKLPFHIPVAVGLIDSKGRDLPLQLKGETSTEGLTTRVLEVKKESETFCFTNIPELPIPSVLRHFSAPVKLRMQYNEDELKFLLANDSDGFNRWEADQHIASRVILQLVAAYQKQKTGKVEASFIETYRKLLLGNHADKSFTAELITLPSESYLGELMSVIDVDAIHHSRQLVRLELARHLQTEFLNCYQKNLDAGPYKIDLESIAQRRLKNTSLQYLMQLNTEAEHKLCYQQFKQAHNMTDQLSALIAFANTDCPEREEVIQSFYEKWQDDALVVDKWFAIQARSELPGALQRVRQLLTHPAFQIKNPNKVRALIGTFCQENIAQFHAKNGEGYEFLAEKVLLLDKLNPQVAARLLIPLTNWRRYDKDRQLLMCMQLKRIVGTKDLSKDVYEVAAKSL